jgi:sulfatase maturation enzyme AslB (radical SAM superfamily)
VAKEDGTVYRVQNDSMNSIMSSSYMENIRQQMLKGEKPDGCKICWEEEASGGRSKRIRENNRHRLWFDKILTGKLDEPTLVHWDINLGTVCNLRCRICGAHSSSKWARDIKQMKAEYKNEMPVTHWDWDRVEESISDGNWSIRSDIPFWNDLYKNIPSTSVMEFFGGEPLYQKQHDDIMRKCVESGAAENIHVHYNTNGTILNEKLLREYWPKFKFVSIMFSIDGVGKRFNYMRNPAQWQTVADNIKRWQDLSADNMKLELCPTSNLMSYYYMDELLEWADSIGMPVWLNLLHGPSHFNIKNYPNEVKQELLNKHTTRRFEMHNEYMLSEHFTELSKFFKHIDFWDKWRGENFDRTFPELSERLRPYA